LVSFQEENTTCIKIIDNRIGIAADKLETVFESFAQGSIEINRKYGGTGLGLTIVKKINYVAWRSNKIKRNYCKRI
jgi:signal transduction histidine kinase